MMIVIKILAITRHYDTCKYYRLDNPFKYLDKTKFDTKVFLSYSGKQGPLESGDAYNKREKDHFDNLAAMIDWSDIFIVQRGTTDQELELMRIAKAKGKKTITESDDCYTHVPSHNPGHVYFMNRQRQIRQILQEADVVTVSTEALKKIYSPFNDDIRVLYNSIDYDAFDRSPLMYDFHKIVECARMPFKIVDDICQGRLGRAPKVVEEYFIDIKQMKEKIGDRTVILWSGSPTHLFDIEQIIPAMTEITRSRDDIAFLIGGYVPGRLFSGCYRRNMYLVSMVPMDHYYGLYKTIAPDVVLAPVLPDKFNQGKSALRIIEAMSFRAFPVASNYVTYTDFINKGALIDCNAKSWKKGLPGILNMKKEDRMQAIEENEAYARKNFDMRTNVVEWEQLYESLVQ